MNKQERDYQLDMYRGLAMIYVVCFIHVLYWLGLGGQPLSDWKMKVSMMKKFIEVCSVDSNDIFSSCDSAWCDYEDSVQFQVAKKSACDIIVTRNTRDFFNSDISVLTPDEVIGIIG